MSAQLGSSVVLDYGPQGSQQLGSSLVLDFYVAPTTRRITAGTRAPWSTSAPSRSEIVGVAPMGEQLAMNRFAPWNTGHLLLATRDAEWDASRRSDDRVRAPWLARTKFAQPERLSQWARSAVADDASRVPWGRYTGVAEPSSVNTWLRAAAGDHASLAPWGGPMVILTLAERASVPGSMPTDRVERAPWGRYVSLLAPGVGVLIPPDDGVPTPRIVVPLRSVYVQVNTRSLSRVSDGVPIPAISISMSLDYASWVWSFNASLPASALNLVEPVDGEPVELEALVNGTAFRLLVEGISRDRTFDRAAIAISGRGKAALLDAPYAPLTNFGNTEDLTLQQLMAGALTFNGVSLGWDVDFALTDWLVPAGAWSHSGSYIDAMNRMAEAGGGYVQADAALQTLHVLPKYPRAPWEWATLVDPDFELPSAPVTRESIQWTDHPKYNRVFVQGMAGGGILGRLTRTGTAGDMVAQSIVDPLITHVDAARQRGLPALALTGRVADISLRLPVLDETGVITPGKFVRYVDGATTRIGLTRAVNLEVGLPQVWQTIKLETHL